MRLSKREERQTTSFIAGFFRTLRTRHSAGRVMYRQTRGAPGLWKKRYGDAGARLTDTPPQVHSLHISYFDIFLAIGRVSMIPEFLANKKDNSGLLLSGCKEQSDRLKLKYIQTAI